MDRSIVRDVVISLALLGVTWALYTGSIIADPGAAVIHEWKSPAPLEPAPFRMNFLFDTDGPRFIHALTAEKGYGGEEYTYRHPIAVLLLAPVMSILRLLGIPAVLAGLLISAFFGAAAVGAAYLVLRRWRLGRLAAGLWAVLFAVSTPIWLMSSVADSFPANALCIIGVFALTDPRIAQPRRYPRRFTGYLLFAVVAIGLTVANAVYIAGGFTVAWWMSRTGTREDLRAPVALVLGIVISLAVLVEVQDWLYPITKGRRAVPYSHLDFLVVDWDTAPERLSMVAQTMGPDALLMRRPEIGMTPSWYYPRAGQMIVFGPRGALYWCSLLGLAAVLGFGAIVRSRDGTHETGIRGRHLLLASAFIAYNLVFALVFEGYHGAPVLFAVHVVFPMIVLFAGLTAGASRSRGFTTALITAVLLITVANTSSLLDVRRLANRPCHEWAPPETYPVHFWPICAEWEPTP